ncbi:MAG: cadmium-translocating P-type ATPase [Dorea sp.]|nr:cadmium-translocating P-type ATPase [Dorea sp.]
MEKRLRQRCIIYFTGVFLYSCAVAAAVQYTISDRYKFMIFLVPYLVMGYGVFRTLSESLLKRRLPADHLMIVLATAGAFGVGRYIEGAFVMFLFELGMIFEAVSVDRTKRSIAEMIDIRPAYAVRKINGIETKVEPSELCVNHIIVIKPGERIPVDAVITSGITTVDTKALTGEMMPETVRRGDKIYGGCINLSSMIEARVVREYKESTVSRIMDMVEDAQNNKAESETFTTRLSKIYTPVMFICALVLMLVPPMTFSYGNWNMWIYRGLIFMIVACPCGLVVSVPIAFLGGIASAARNGIVVKGGNYLENLAKADTFVFDKTGTLTEGVFTVERVKALGMSKEELMEIVAHIETYSNHPIAKSLVAAYHGRFDRGRVRHMKEMPGYGISASYDGYRVDIGNIRMMEKKKVLIDDDDTTGTLVYVSIGGKYVGHIVIRDMLKEHTKDTLNYLKEKCHAVLVMLTGDTKNSARVVAEELDIDYTYTNLMPQDKLERLEDFLFLQDDTERLVCVGDGINDAPILARADVGIAMGNLGSAAAVEAADIILLEDDLPKIIDAIRIAKETLHVVSRNIIFALIIKFFVLIFAAIGYFGMWEAILAEIVVMLMAIINAGWVVKYTA